jgi:hypothetical protein
VSQLLKRFTDLPSNRRGLSIEAVITLGIARLLVLCVPIRWITRLLERPASRAPLNIAPTDEIVREVGWAVRAAAPKTPWKSACLPQALAGKWMLARRGIHGTIRLGVAKNASGGLEAHAWLYSGGVILTGGGEPMRRFTPIGELE